MRQRRSVERTRGDGVSVSFKPIGFWGRVWRERKPFLQLVIAAFTWIGALIAAWGTWLKSTGDKATTWESETAAIVLILVAVLATLKFIKETNEI